MKKGLILSLICLLTLCGCGKIPTLQNGEEAVITFAKDEKEHKISAEELFEELKTNFGLEATLKLIDTYILETEFEDYKEEATTNAENYIEAMIESYGDEKTLLEAIQYNTNYSTIEAYQEYLYISFMQSHALEEYAKNQVTDKEIETYYNDEAKGDVEVYHILITPDVTDDMKSDEKTKAEDEAMTKAKDIIKKLNKADNKLEEFKKLVKEFSEDEATKKKDGNLGYINYGDLDKTYDELLDAVYKLKDGNYSKEVVTTELGYHVIYRNASKEKASLKDLKEEIIETLANRKMEKDSEISLNSMKYYRELYNMKIIDSTLDRQYGIYLNNLANQSTTKTEK
ncbi:MAG: peptidylprolyl isomerase [Bacilli bacterium]|nr:peptidylprolyl isomerase [Bacilli bacterium]